MLPPAYVVRREGNSFTLLVCPHLGGGGGQVSPAGGGGGSAKIGQQNESTHYTAGGMPLAFTQEDFLVDDMICSQPVNSNIQKFDLHKS